MKSFFELKEQLINEGMSAKPNNPTHVNPVSGRNKGVVAGHTKAAMHHYEMHKKHQEAANAAREYQDHGGVERHTQAAMAHKYAMKHHESAKKINIAHGARDGARTSSKTRSANEMGKKAHAATAAAKVNDHKYSDDDYMKTESVDVELDEANYDIKKAKSNKPYEIKGGEIHISKANFRKVHKDYKNTTKGKERMMALDPKTGGSASFKVVFTKEEVELDEATMITGLTQQQAKNLMDTASNVGIKGKLMNIKGKGISVEFSGKNAKEFVGAMGKFGMKTEQVELDEAGPKIDPAKMAAHMARNQKPAKPKKMSSTQKSLADIRQRAESVEIDEAKGPISKSQIAALKKAYEGMRGKRISLDNANKLMTIMDKVKDDKDGLMQLYKANIPFVSVSAMTRLMQYHNVKPAELKATGVNPFREEVELDEKKGAFHLYDNEADARKKAKEVGGKVIKGTGKSAGKWAVKEGVQFELQEAEGGIKVPAGADHDRKVRVIQNLAKQLGAKVTKVGKSTDGKLTTIHVKGSMRVINDLLKLRTEAYEAKNPAQQAAIAIDKKKRDEKDRQKAVKFYKDIKKGKYPNIKMKKG